MTITGAAWSTAVQAELTLKGNSGSKLGDFADVIGFGCANYIVGKSFTTTDAGAVSGSGTGTGTGITGLTAGSIASIIESESTSSFGQAGTSLNGISDAIGKAAVSQMALATLSSVHAPVFSGTGTIDPGSIAVDAAGWGSSISGEGPAKGMNGSQFGNFANAIGKGHADHISSNGTGTVTISGSGGDPSGGAGTGTGTIS